jgi:hypothetical protein
MQSMGNTVFWKPFEQHVIREIEDLPHRLYATIRQEVV